MLFFEFTVLFYTIFMGDLDKNIIAIAVWL